MKKLLTLSILGLALGAGFALAQRATNPAPSAVACVYNSSPPVATSGTFIIVQCDASGNLQVH